MSIAGLAYDNFKPEVWSEAVNERLHTINVGLSLTTTRYRGEIRRFGDRVQVVRPGTVTSRTAVAYSDTTFEQPDDALQTIVVDQAEYAAVDVDDIDRVQSAPNLLRDHTVDATASISDGVDVFVFGAYASAGSGIGSDHDNPVRLTAVGVWGLLTDAGKVFSQNNVPMQGRWAALSAGDVDNLRSNPLFTAQLPAAERAMRQRRPGEVGSAAGFAIYQTNNLTTLSGVRKVLLGHARAVGMAGPLASARAERREARFSTAVKVLSIYGKTVIEPNALAVIHAEE